MRRPTTALAAAFLAATLAVGGTPVEGAGQEDVATVAVLDFTGFMMGESGNSVSLGKAVSAMLVTEFSGRDGMRVIERARLSDLLTEQRLALSGRMDAASAVEVGRLLGAQYVVTGQVSSVGETLRADIRAVDVETSEVVAVLKKTGTPAELLAVVVEIADELTRDLSLTPPSERPELAPVPVPATIEFSRAVDYEDRGETEKAIEHYRAALEIAPDHPGARRALERLGAGGGS